ncbi:unnamed protein product [Cuscuta europaea]|uniref:Uncharacterized protein n=1 Tax=Cuscuta europaea TaxID=41803 RepID=A0A9P0YSZ1_CUSEU|nr:unnamed protein product [Cuscuta europaea]
MRFIVFVAVAILYLSNLRNNNLIDTLCIGLTMKFREPLSESNNPSYLRNNHKTHSDASDDFDHSDESFFSDDFLGHASETDRRPPLSNREEIKKSKVNRSICRKSRFVNSDN